MHGYPWWYGLVLDPRAWLVILLVLLALLYVGVKYVVKKVKHKKTNAVIPTIVLAPNSIDPRDTP